MGQPNPLITANSSGGSSIDLSSLTRPTSVSPNTHPSSSTVIDHTNKHTLVLENMVSASQMEGDPTLEADIEEEARTYGELREQILFEVLDRDRVNIKIIYAHSADAYRAYMAMQGRCFDGKTIKATLT